VTAPDWTDHDVSDPGVTLLEVLAYTLGALGVATATITFLRRRRTSGISPDS
jgi:hypothetical protein